MRVLTVVGNRPQFIKSAPLSAALREAGIEEVVLHTGQHYDRELSEVFFEELGLAEPRYRLGLGPPTPAAMVPGIRGRGRARSGPTGCSSSATRTRRSPGPRRPATTPIAHVEAGLRSFDLSMPEERNRIAVDRPRGAAPLPRRALARAAPSARESAAEALVVGDVMADAHRLFAPIARERSRRARAARASSAGGYLLVTVHREANVRARAARAHRRRAQPRSASRSSSRPIRARGPRSRGLGPLEHSS